MTRQRKGITQKKRNLPQEVTFSYKKTTRGGKWVSKLVDSDDEIPAPITPRKCGESSSVSPLKRSRFGEQDIPFSEDYSFNISAFTPRSGKVSNYCIVCLAINIKLL